METRYIDARFEEIEANIHIIMAEIARIDREIKQGKNQEDEQAYQDYLDMHDGKEPKTSPSEVKEEGKKKIKFKKKDEEQI